MKKISFRVRKQYYEQIVIGNKTEELRKLSFFWMKRLCSDHPPQIAVFLCGHRVHRRRIDAIYYCIAEELLDRELSDQGIMDVQTEVCICTELAEGQCDRCYSWTDRIYPHRWQEFENITVYYGQWVEMNTCWECDHDIINGGDPWEDSYDIEEERRIRDWEEDPLNNPYPY